LAQQQSLQQLNELNKFSDINSAKPTMPLYSVGQNGYQSALQQPLYSVGQGGYQSALQQPLPQPLSFNHQPQSYAHFPQQPQYDLPAVQNQNQVVISKDDLNYLLKQSQKRSSKKVKEKSSKQIQPLIFQ